MIRNFYALVVACSATLSAMAQDSTEKKSALAFSGSADVYYKYNLQKNAANTFTSFTNTHNSFELGMISGKIEHHGDKVSFVGDMGFGKRIEQFSYNDEKSQIMIKQLFVAYAPASFIKFSMGSWATHIGYEYVDPYMNRNYSMSYMFSYGPFFHTGFKTDIMLGQHALMIGIAEPADLKSALEGSNKFFIGQYSFGSKDGNFKSYFNALSGNRKADSIKTTQLDLVLTQKIIDRLSLGFNTSYSHSSYYLSENTSSKDWWGAALYVNYDNTKLWGLTYRTEYFNDKQQQNVFQSATTGGWVWANTVSANFKLSSLTLIPEVRYETSNRGIYASLGGNSRKNDTSLLIAAVYQF